MKTQCEIVFVSLEVSLTFSEVFFNADVLNELERRNLFECNVIPWWSKIDHNNTPGGVPSFNQIPFQPRLGCTSCSSPSLCPAPEHHGSKCAGSIPPQEQPLQQNLLQVQKRCPMPNRMLLLLLLLLQRTHLHEQHLELGLVGFVFWGFWAPTPLHHVKVWVP